MPPNDATRSAAAPVQREIPWHLTVSTLAILAAWLFGLRLLGPSNLTDNDQERPAAYVLDALRHGHWFVQYDWTGDIASKPPLYTWLAAGLSWVAGGAQRWTLYLPCALAMLGSALLVANRLRLVAGSRPALLGGIFVLANPLSAKLVALARTDAVFTFCITLAAVSAHAAWSQIGSGSARAWIRTWFFAALATLTKGPLGLLLGFSGLLAAIPGRRYGMTQPWSRAHFLGLLLWLAIVGGWFLGAWHQAGDPLIRKMIHAELVGHALRQEGGPRGVGLVLVPAYFLSRFAPWSLLACWGIWTASRHPELAREPRSLQQFSAAWLLTGIVVLGLASHQRGDLVAPLIPAGAILAAFPADRLLSRWSGPRLLWTTLVVSMLFAVGIHAQHLVHRSAVMTESRGAQQLAASFRKTNRPLEKLAHTDTPYALQFELGTMDRALDFDQAAGWLRSDPGALISVADPSRLAAALGPDAARLQAVATWPEGTEKARFSIMTLRPR